MVKDSRKYVSTGGWRFAQFRDGEPADATVHVLPATRPWQRAILSSPVPRQERHLEKRERAVSMNMKLEVVIDPVSDIDRAKAFYEKAGFRLDIDIANETFAAYDSPLLDRRRRSSSARESPRRSRAPRNSSTPPVTT